jgi:hypothetical protein
MKYALQGKTADISSSLTNLVRSFGRREQGLVQSLISDTRDPFYNLPTELLICIFDYLHPYDVWSKRLISRRWNDVLSSDKFTGTALSRFETHDPADSALDPETHASSSHMLQIRHMLALRNGRPFSYVNYKGRFAFKPDTSPVGHQLQLKGKHIAYLWGNAKTRDGDTVVVRDLITGEATSLRGIAREKIMLIALSTDIIAFFTYVGTVYVASLLALPDPPQSIRLPSSKIYATYADQGILACLLEGASGLTVLIHDNGTRKSTSFSHDRRVYCVGEEEDVHCHQVLVNSCDRVVDIFSVLNSNVDMKIHVRVARYSFAGELTTLDCLTIYHGLENQRNLSLGSALPTGERGLFQLDLSSAHNMPSGTILFDTTFDPNAVTLKLVDKNQCSTTIWKDRRYRTEVPEVLIDTALRPAPFDGPQSLRALRNEAVDHCMTDDEYLQAIEDGLLEDEHDHESDIPTPSTWCPSSLRSWKYGRRHPKVARVDKTRYEDMPTVLPALVSLPPLEGPVAMVHSNEERWQKLPAHALHTIVAMNDTFAVGTCVHPDYIGVMCFDERVNLHGAGPTDLWVHPNNPHYERRPEHPDNENQIGPGFLTLKRPVRPPY